VTCSCIDSTGNTCRQKKDVFVKFILYVWSKNVFLDFGKSIFLFYKESLLEITTTHAPDKFVETSEYIQ